MISNHESWMQMSMSWYVGIRLYQSTSHEADGLRSSIMKYILIPFLASTLTHANNQVMINILDIPNTSLSSFKKWGNYIKQLQNTDVWTLKWRVGTSACEVCHSVGPAEALGSPLHNSYVLIQSLQPTEDPACTVHKGWVLGRLLSGLHPAKAGRKLA